MVAATIGSDTFTSDAVAAIVYGNVEISARAGGRVLALAFPPTPGSYDCAAGAIIGVGYFQQDADGLPVLDYRSWLSGNPTACTVTVQTVGNVGERIDGSFAVTLYNWRLADGGAATLVANGTFSVERGAY
jgi:hypothetical protein